MKKFVGIVVVAVLAGCSQTDERNSNAEAGICLTLDQQMIELQKEASFQLENHAYQVRQAGRVDASVHEDRSWYRQRLLVQGDLKAERNALLTLMAGHGCELPPEPPSLAAYNQAAFLCRIARDESSADRDQLCNRETWQPMRPDRERRPVPPVREERQIVPLPDNDSGSE